MAITDFLRNAGRGAAGIGRAVAGALQQPRRPEEENNSPGLADAPTMEDFMLPDIGPAPSQDDERYMIEGTPADQFSRDLEDWQHKKNIHDQFMELDRIYSEAHPKRDFKGEYAQELAALNADKNYAPEGSFLKRFALALGDFNPAVQEPNLPKFEKAQTETQKRHDFFEGKKAELTKRMHEQQAKDAEAKGNWKKALAENQALQLLEFDKERRAASDKAALEESKQQAALERAQLRKEAIIYRANQIADNNNLEGEIKELFIKEAVKQYAERYGSMSMMATGSPFDMDQVTDDLSDLLEGIRTKLKPKSDTGGAPAPKPKKELEDF